MRQIVMCIDTGRHAKAVLLISTLSHELPLNMIGEKDSNSLHTNLLSLTTKTAV